MSDPLSPKTKVQVLDLSEINLDDDQTRTELSPRIETPKKDEVDCEAYTDPQQEFMRPTIKLSGPGIPFESYIIGSEETYIGRDPNQCQICIDDPGVSRIHAVIKKHQSNFWIEDLLSSGGTYFNQKRINKTDLEHGSQIVIGPVTVTLLVDSPFMQKEKKGTMPVEENQTQTIYEEREEDEFNEEDEYTHRGEEAPNAREKWLYPSLAAIALAFLLKGQLFSHSKSPELKRDLASKKQTQLKALQEEKKSLEIKEKYNLAKQLFNEGQYKKSLSELDNILIDYPKHNKSKALREVVMDAFRAQESKAIRDRKKKEMLAKEKKLSALIKKAESAFKDKQLILAEGYADEILKLDPQNLDGDLMKREIASFKKNEKARLEKEAKEKTATEVFNKKFAKAKSFERKGDYYNAILSLENLMTNETNPSQLAMAQKMHSSCQQKLNDNVNPRLKAAKEAMEDGDLKRAYRKFQEVLKYSPNHAEAHKKGQLILKGIEENTRKVYREAIVLESMSLFDEAKEKYRDVLEISPSDNPYHKKATQRLSQFQ